MRSRAGLVAALVGLTVCLGAIEAVPAAAPDPGGERALSQPALNPTELHDRALRVMETYCGSCHGSDKQEGEVRFDALDSIDPVDQQQLFGNIKEVVHLHEKVRSANGTSASDGRARRIMRSNRRS